MRHTEKTRSEAVGSNLKCWALAKWRGAFLSCSVRFQTEVLLLRTLGMCLKESLQLTHSENRANVHLIIERQLLFWAGILERNVKKKEKKGGKSIACFTCCCLILTSCLSNSGSLFGFLGATITVYLLFHSPTTFQHPVPLNSNQQWIDSVRC